MIYVIRDSKGNFNGSGSSKSEMIRLASAFARRFSKEFAVYRIGNFDAPIFAAK